MEFGVERLEDEPSTSTTPPRGRVQSRLPATPSRGLPGRVPLHRRGTSRIYERMEDLLKEAGYKETKIYTPETDRVEERRGGVGAVVDFISGWIPGGRPQQSNPSSQEGQTRERNPSPSPLPRRMPSHSEAVHGRGLRPRSSATDSLRAYAQRAALQGQLRYMASTPNMARRHSSNDRRIASSRSHNPPPMPSNWLDTVTKAVVGSSAAGVHVGGPPSGRSSSRTTPSSTSAASKNATISKRRTNTVRPLTSYLRPKTAPSALTTCNVVCRSAPASRSSSRSRDSQPSRLDKGKRRDVRPTKGKRSSKSSDNVPTLAATRLENDVWETQWLDGHRVSATLSDDPDTYQTDDDDDEEEGELDLARLLVDPKRQNSIHSLRRHLHRSESARALRERNLLQKEPWIFDEEEDSTKKRNKQRNGSRRTSIEDCGGFSWADAPGFEVPSSRKRRGIPSTWSKRNGRS